MISFENTKVAFQGKSKKELKKSFWLFKLVANNTLVKVGPFFLNIALFLRLPIIGLIKNTIYKQFCGGESMSKSKGTINELAKYNIGTILDYSVEGKNSEIDFERLYNEIIESVKMSDSNSNIPFTVFKVSGLAPYELLTKVSANEKLNNAETLSFQLLNKRLEVICNLAHELKVRIFIDAEESWIQDAIDSIALDLMRKYNTQEAIIYNTLQMYRWDRLDYLKKCFEDAKNNKFYLGLKIVRGAYMEKERERSENLNYPSPIHIDKASTDIDYDLAIEFCTKNLKVISICAGTHNETSSMKLIELMEDQEISKEDPSIYFSQLLGMSDHISYNLSQSGYNVAKYVPYGPVKDVLPYLIRRAQENTSISGQTTRELGLIMKEVKRRRKTT